MDEAEIRKYILKSKGDFVANYIAPVGAVFATIFQLYVYLITGLTFTIPIIVLLLGICIYMFYCKRFLLFNN